MAPSSPGIFRFADARAHSAAVAQFLDAQSSELGQIARTWFQVMRACGPDVREVMHDGHATACAGDAAFAYVAVFSSHVNVGFYQGAALPDPGGLLEGTGKAMRHVKLRPADPVDAGALEALVRAAYRDMRERTSAG